MRFGTDGLRGSYGSELTEDLACRLGAAVAEVIRADGYVVGGDSRESTTSLEAALVAGLAQSGAPVERLGLAPTPLIAHRAARTGAAALVVSASHNPFHDNGIKVFGPGGAKLDPASETAIEALLERDCRPPTVAPTPDGPDQVVVADYIEHLRSVVDGRPLDGLRVVVDAANGAASNIATTAMGALGVEAEMIEVAPDGRNINAECLYFDTEAAVNKSLLASRGVDLSRVVVVNVVTIEDFRSKALKAVDIYLKTDAEDRKPCMFVLDSLGMLSTEKEITDSLNDKQVRDMTKSQLVKGAFRMLTLKLGQANIPMIVTNHTYDVIGSYVPTIMDVFRFLRVVSKKLTPEFFLSFQSREGQYSGKLFFYFFDI